MNNVQNMAANVSVANGNLVLTLASSTSGAGVSSAPYNGAGANGYLLQVGDYAEARVYFPGSSADGVYNWPAWWASGPRWPAAGEHDVAEGLYGDLTVNYHSPSGAHNQGEVPGVWFNEFHTYGVLRMADKAKVYWDGVLVKSYTTDDNGEGGALLLNVGKSGSRAAVTGPAGQVKVDYVRAWGPAG
jgi:beta-glucanase (GH16 family)